MTAMAALLLASTFCPAAAPACTAGGALASLTPPPQKITHYSTSGVTLTSAWRVAVAGGSGSQHTAALAGLAEALADKGLPALRVVDAAEIRPTEQQLILLGVPDAEASVASAAGAAARATIRSLHVTHSMSDAHMLSIGAGRILALGSGPSGAFYSVQTLIQLINASHVLPSCLIEDFPDSPLRGFRIWAAPVSLENMSWVNGMVDLMSHYKLNFGPISANAFYSQPFDNMPWPANATADHAFLQKVKSKFDSRFLEMVPDFSFGSITHDGLSALYPGISEGLWAKNEPFTVTEDMLLMPVANPITDFPLNGDLQVLNSSSGSPAHWTIHPPGSITGEPGGKTRRGSCYVDSRDSPPADGRGRGNKVMRCDVWCDPAGGPCLGSPGFESEQIKVKAGDILYMSAWTKTEANCSVPNGGPELLLGHESCILFDPKWKGCSPGAGTAIPRTKGKWKPFGVTFHAVSDVNLSVSTRMKSEGESIDNCSWSVAHPRILRVNSALLNVLQTNSTDVNVSAIHPDGDNAYVRNVDFEVLPPTKAKITGRDTDLWALYNKSLANRSAWGYSVRALPGGKLRAGNKVWVSYDVSAGAVGWGDWSSNPQAFGEAGFYESSCIILAQAIKLARPKHVMTGMDEVRGINRDSRSRRLGLSNGRMFAHAMNKLAACIHQASVENGLDVKPLFWADMVSPVHNGGIYGYQADFGGFPGNSSEAMQYLDPTIGLIPWYYGSSDGEIAHLNASDRVCEGRLSPLPTNRSSLATPLEWIGGSGSNTPNVQAWAANLAASKHGLGMLGTEWHFEQPDLSALPATAAFSWNHRGSSNVSCNGMKTDDGMVANEALSPASMDSRVSMVSQISNYTITIAHNATPVERFAAQELRTLLLTLVENESHYGDDVNSLLPIVSLHDGNGAGGTCALALARTCGDVRPYQHNASHTMKCDVCASSHTITLRGAGCGAAEVQRWCTGQQLVNDLGWQLAVGTTPSLALGVPSNWLEYSRTGDEGFAVCSFASIGGVCGGTQGTNFHVAMSGAAAASRGTLYAVYHYLEKLGFAFIAPDETKLPNATTATFLGARMTSTGSVFEYREANSVSDSLSLFPDPAARQLWAIRNRYNAVPTAPNLSSPIKREGVYATPPGFVHTSYSYLAGFMVYGNGGPSSTPAVAKIFAKNTEWFWPRNESVYGQLCWSNASLVQYLIKQTKTFLRMPVNANTTIISLSQNDNGYMCRDPAEMEIVAAEQSPMGPLLRAVNAVADSIATEFPGVAVDTLAYDYTRAVPALTRPRQNVIIRYCVEPGGCDLRGAVPEFITNERYWQYNAPHSDNMGFNTSVDSELQAWAGVTKRIYLWDYSTNFNNLAQPFPNWFNLAPNIAFFARHSVKGVFEEGAFRGPGGDMAALKDFVVGKLLFQPELNGQELIELFLQEYYGTVASPYVRSYMAFLHGSVAQSETVCAGWGGSNCLNIGCNGDHYVSYLFKPMQIVTALNFILHAEKACAQSSKHLWRVQQLSVSILYTVLWRYEDLASLPEFIDILPQPKLEIWHRFQSYATRMGIVNFKASEGYGLDWMCGYMFRDNVTENATACSQVPAS